MDAATIRKAFINVNINLRPDALRKINELLGVYLDKKLLDRFVKCASELNIQILEAENVEKIKDLIIKGGSKQGFDQMKIIKEQIKLSVIVLDYFDQNRFKIENDPKNKQNMWLNRLKHIETLLRKDKRYSFGYSNEESFSISQIGTVIGSIGKIHHILGLLIQIGQYYYLSDGLINLRLEIKKAQNKNLFPGDNPCQVNIGVVNIGSVILVTGEWNESYSYFEVYIFTIPDFDVKGTIKESIQSSDLREIRNIDTFGVYDKIISKYSSEHNLTLERQKALNIFLNQKKIKSIFVFSNFSLDNLLCIKKLDNLFDQAQSQMKAPGIIILVGQFSSQTIPNQDNLYGNELVKIIKKYEEYLKNTFIFFIPSYNDFPLAYSLPKTPLNLQLLMKEPTKMMHSLCNPCKLSICGFNVVIVRNDISKEIRKSHIQSFQADHRHLSETIIAQQYLGTFNSQQICYKWNYDHAMQLDPSVDLVVLCDQSIQQYQYQTKINDTQVLNPGNFMNGEFGTIKVTNRIIGEVSKI